MATTNVDGGDLKAAYLARRAELERASGGVEARLAAAGDLMRRSRALGVRMGEIEEALRAVAARHIEDWLRQRARVSELARAIDDAFESAIADREGERASHASSALEGLRARDRVESVLVAIGKWQALDPKHKLSTDAARALERWRTAVLREDESARDGARSLAALNGTRRRERDLLDEARRADAWWFSARAECDDVLLILRGEPAPKTWHCATCARDHERAKTIESPPKVHVSADALWRYDFGLAPTEERKTIERHASRCAECKRALDALADGDRAIAALAEDRRPPPGASGGRGDALGEHDAFRVLITRGPKRTKLRVVPRGEQRLKSVVVYLDGSKKPLAPKRTAAGVEFDFAARASGERASRGARVIVELADVEGSIEVRCDLK